MDFIIGEKQKLKELIKMKYSIDESKEYSKRNELEKWIQLFLRDNSYEYSGPNISLANGLLLEDRFYMGPILLDLDKLTTVRIEKDIFNENDLDYYNKVVNRIVNDYKNFNLPPLIVEYKNSKLYLTDGNHRYSALRKLGINKYYVIIWGNKELKNEVELMLKNLINKEV